MVEAATKLPIKTEATEAKEGKAVSKSETWPAFESLRREMNRLFDDFDRDFWTAPFRRSVFDIAPFWRREAIWTTTPAVDIVEGDKAYEVTVELPGLDEKDIEVKLTNGNLTIKGEKQEEKEEKKKDYYLHERKFGAFERRLRLPDGVDAERIEAKFRQGVLTVTLPKKAEAQKPDKKIAVKAG